MTRNYRDQGGCLLKEGGGLAGGVSQSAFGKDGNAKHSVAFVSKPSHAVAWQRRKVSVALADLPVPSRVVWGQRGGLKMLQPPGKT